MEGAVIVIIILILSLPVLMLGTFSEAIKAHINCTRNDYETIECISYKSPLLELIIFSCPFIFLAVFVLSFLTSCCARYKTVFGFLCCVWIIGSLIGCFEAQFKLENESTFDTVTSWSWWYTVSATLGLALLLIGTIGYKCCKWYEDLSNTYLSRQEVDIQV